MPLPRATSDELIFVGSSGDGNRGRALFSVLPLREGLIGSAAHCELRFADPFMAAEHGRLARIDGRWFLTSAAIGISVFVDGHQPPPGQGYRLEPGALVEVADTWFLVGGGPDRPQIPLGDPIARAAVGDRLVELGDPLAEYVNAPPLGWPEDLKWFVERVDDVAFDGALVQRATVRADEATSPITFRSQLREFLTHPICTAIESLTIATETLTDDALENARLVLHAIAAACPPRLNTLSLGVVAIETLALEDELAALARALPLRTQLSELVRTPAPASIVVLEAVGWAPRQRLERIPLTDGLAVMRSGELEQNVGEHEPGVGLRFRHRGAGRWSADTGGDSAGRSLRTGDELAVRDLIFRFET